MNIRAQLKFFEYVWIHLTNLLTWLTTSRVGFDFRGNEGEFPRNEMNESFL